MPGLNKLLHATFLTSVVVCWALLSSPTTHSANEDIRLPDIGDPASAVLSRAEERRLGSMILGQIRSNLRVLNDPEMDTYIQSLGTRLVSAGVDSDLKFTFLLLVDPSINAFAAPGGIVAVNTGLLTTSNTESELAGVVAHEIAHIEQRHLARAYANASKINLATALGVLASIAAGLYNSELGGAALHSTIAAGAQAQLAFSRSHEREADRVGMALLVNANFDPQGMPNFLQRLHKQTQLNAGPIPEFLSTHPVTLSRISDTRSRAAQYRGPFERDSERFQYVKARTIALTAAPSAIISHYEQSRRKTKNTTPVNDYMFAIALTRSGDPKKAITVLRKIEQDAEILPVQLALAQAYLGADRANKAQEILRRLDDIYPNQEAIVYYLAQSLMDQGRPADALARLGKLTNANGHNPSLDQLRAQAAQLADEPWLSHESMASFYMAHGHYSEALQQLELALNDYRIDAVAQARIRSKRRELQSLSEEQ